MFDYFVRRLLQVVPVLLGVTIIVFGMVHLIPGDPAEILAGSNATIEDIQSIRQKLSLDKPLMEQYFIYMKNIFKGDLGTSIRTRRPVLEDMIPRYGNSLLLASMFGRDHAFIRYHYGNTVSR